ncbi:AMP-binding protein [Conexibacter sp. CPCC 206217]|uniref:AMP-binding protein n=1 Tax=Conexibacter sp. CPCC 206217 TaxID=3064574 RepID=UPI0027231327|nr:AMP-binding protein [Conexibacter sp. CPCC 206217]MDO8212411.1 AMP-binding protein [Conexibacter sp. CPCC 206217]
MLDPLGDRTLTDLLEERVAANGERTFLVFEDGAGTISELTYRDFDARVERCARGLSQRGVAQGDFVVLHLRNSPEFLIAWFALARLGAVLIPSNVANTVGELEHILSFTSARLAITEPSLLETVDRAITASGNAVSVVVARGTADGRERFEDLLTDDRRAPRPSSLSGSDLAELIFTSGTTRKPKAVMLTHANCIRSGLDAVHCLWLDEGERCLTALPLFHVNGQAMSVLATLTVGGTLVLIEEFRASRFWSQVRAHRATQTCIVAMQLRTLIAQPPDPAERDHQVRRLFYAINVTDEEKTEFEQRFGISLINGYGLSEAMTLLTCAPVVGPRRWPSIGLPSPGRRLLLLDPEGNEVPQGEVGEVVVEGTPGRDIMLGYYRDPEATAGALRGNRMHTGDNAYADEAGYLYFFDRKKDMIKRAGENVSAIEVEGALVSHPGVAEAAVVGVPDAIRDEAVAAIVVAAAPGGLTEEEIVEHCRQHLSKFKVPTVVQFVDELPKTSIGKVRKDVLRRALADAATPSG